MEPAESTDTRQTKRRLKGISLMGDDNLVATRACTDDEGCILAYSVTATRNSSWKSWAHHRAINGWEMVGRGMGTAGRHRVISPGTPVYRRASYVLKNEIIMGRARDGATQGALAKGIA
jgi:hypothetical protein